MISAYFQPSLELECNPYRGITLDAAKQIAHDFTNYVYAVGSSPFDSMGVYDAIQPRWFLYNLPDLEEPCWFVTVAGYEPPALRSTMVVVISRSTGRVIYGGSACDEG